ncbi:hypothetical protein AYI69_g5157 [Smittium culicis]|uniref:Uncharacterized protein n=1 Tax=Smittium culicis TaxID=133412 RepID=A0A1R1Y844_9FUNG|nr:hypothetical protein AYI69_g5157 [Smittium culicis]
MFSYQISLVYTFTVSFDIILNNLIRPTISATFIISVSCFDHFIIFSSITPVTLHWLSNSTITTSRITITFPIIIIPVPVILVKKFYIFISVT